ncbi:Cytochrome P450 [Sphingobium faniae]|nr:Cytochrome P450 [Sphingobium faniae]
MQEEESMMTQSAAKTRPAHVSESTVMDIDIYNIPVVDCDVGATWLDIKARAPSPVIWSEYNGGHWIALHGADVKTAFMTPAIFSSTDIFIPPNGSRDNVLIPLEQDPPESLLYRKVIVPPLMPGNLAPVTDIARKTAIELIEGFKPRGGCEFVKEFALVLPVVVFLSVMGLPLEDRDYLYSLAEKSTRPESPEQRLEGHMELKAYLQHYIADRKANPRDDLLSKSVNAIIDGEPITDFAAQQFVLNTTIGGLDTVANLLGFVMHFLAHSPDHRRQLIERPDLINNATDELIRRFGIVGQGRRIMEDTELSGVPLMKGDMIWAPTWMYGLDEQIVADPLTVNFERPTPPHMTFGGGPHVCAGMHLAKREIRITLEEWLPRIPDFHVSGDVVVETGGVTGITRLPLVW